MVNREFTALKALFMRCRKRPSLTKRGLLYLLAIAAQLQARSVRYSGKLGTRTGSQDSTPRNLSKVAPALGKSEPTCPSLLQVPLRQQPAVFLHRPSLNLYFPFEFLPNHICRSVSHPACVRQARG